MFKVVLGYKDYQKLVSGQAVKLKGSSGQEMEIELDNIGFGTMLDCVDEAMKEAASDKEKTHKGLLPREGGLLY